MKFLFIHQNFPGQFRHVAKVLADDITNIVVAIGDILNIKNKPLLHPNIQMFGYESNSRSGKETHHYIRDFEGHIRRGQNVFRLAIELKNKGFYPDVIVVHPGWGEAIFMRDIFPDARHINYFEYYYQSVGGDVGFDPEFPSTLDDQLKARVKNSTQLISLVSSDQGLSPTQWQKERYPKEFHSKIRVIHEGIDTNYLKPDVDAWIKIGEKQFKVGDEVVTYVARNLEPYRGFHCFMRSIPKLQALRPDAHILIVGGDDVSYGRRAVHFSTYRQQYIQELDGYVDWSKVHFLGKLPYVDYLKILQISAAHVYLTYPFVLSWSMLEAMSVGCILIASATTPVKEVITDGQNGFLVDFFNSNDLAEKIAEVLAEPSKCSIIRTLARQTIIDKYDLFSHCLPEMIGFLKGE